MQQRCADGRLFLLYKMINGHVAVDYSSDLISVTRHIHSASYLLPYEQKKYIQQSFLSRTIAQWNNLPEEVATTSNLDAFKSRVCALNN